MLGQLSNSEMQIAEALFCLDKKDKSLLATDWMSSQYRRETTKPGKEQILETLMIYVQSITRKKDPPPTLFLVNSISVGEINLKFNLGFLVVRRAVCPGCRDADALPPLAMLPMGPGLVDICRSTHLSLSNTAELSAPW